MDNKVKSRLILLVTLLIGVILGMVLQSFIMKWHFEKRVNRLRTARGFTERFERIIQPTDEQRPEVERILENHFQHIQKRMRKPFQELQAQLDTLEMELSKVLTPEQMERLKQFRKRMDGHQKGPKPPFGPPPPMPNE